MAIDTTIELFRAKLRTGGKTTNEISDLYDGPRPSEVLLKELINVYELINGIEVIVMKSFTGGYCLVSWKNEDDEKVREFVYQNEQDEMMGVYKDKREEFIKDWESTEYSPDGSLLFLAQDVEIIEELKKTKF